MKLTKLKLYHQLSKFRKDQTVDLNSVSLSVFHGSGINYGLIDVFSYPKDKC